VDTAKNRAVIAEYFEHSATRDAAGMRRLLADDIVLWIPVSVAERMQRRTPSVGADEFMKGFVSVDHIVVRGSMRWQVHDMTADGDLVWVRATRSAKAVDGRDFENLSLYLFRLEHGRIAEMWEQTDTAYIAGFWGRSHST
jgi:ketosteroid isomerase-like protein